MTQTHTCVKTQNSAEVEPFGLTCGTAWPSRSHKKFPGSGWQSCWSCTSCLRRYESKRTFKMTDISRFKGKWEDLHFVSANISAKIVTFSAPPDQYSYALIIYWSWFQSAVLFFFFKTKCGKQSAGSEPLDVEPGRSSNWLFSHWSEGKIVFLIFSSLKNAVVSASETTPKT